MATITPLDITRRVAIIADLGATLGRVVQVHPELRMTPIADRWPEERIFTHADYHRPTDQPDRINEEKECRLARLLFYLGADIANRGLASPVESRELSADRGSPVGSSTDSLQELECTA